MRVNTQKKEARDVMDSSANPLAQSPTEAKNKQTNKKKNQKTETTNKK